MGLHLLAIDQGTTSTRTIVFRADLTVAAVAQEEFPQHYPASGWVEHDPEDLWRTTVSTMREAIARAGIGPAEIAGIGITNQRETTVVWERSTGRAIHPAIVWQDRRTAEVCAALREDPANEALVAGRTGLRIDPYFSGTKIAWILDAVPGARARAEAGELALRHGRQLPAVAADRRRGARHRRHQRLAHRALRHPPRRLGRGALPAAAGSHGDAAGGEGFLRRLRHHHVGSPRRFGRHPRHGRRPAGGDRRPGLFSAPA